MKESRRYFIKTSAAFGVLSVTNLFAQRRALAATKTIGFVVSTKFESSHIAAFVQALNDKGWEAGGQNAPIFWLSAEGKYGPNHHDLRKHTKLHLDRKVDLIVAAGGLPTAVAVAKELKATRLNTPFIFLIGRYPTTNTGDDADAAALHDSYNKAGGVDQAMAAQNAANFQLLKGKGVTIDKVSLIVNNNNPITRPEVAAWKALSDGGKNPDPDLIYALNGTNDTITSFVSSIADSMKRYKADGLIVSSDPHLRSLGADFDTQLRAAGFSGWVCYPFKAYAFATGANSIYSESTPNLATNDPRDPNTAYYTLGATAAGVLDKLANNKPLNPQLTSWDGIHRKWTTGPFP